MQKIKEVLHVNKDKDKSDKNIEHYGRPGGVGHSEKHGGAPVGTPTGYGTGSHTGHGTHGHGQGVTGVGAGADPASAKHAANEAAKQNKDVAFTTPGGVATGRPEHNASNLTGVGAGADHASAKRAADAAAHQGRDVNIDSGHGVAKGKPVGQVGHATETRATDTHTGAAATGARTGTHNEGDVIDRKYYTGTETRPQDQQLVEQFREHNPYAKEYETTVQHTGRERQIGADVEHLGSRVRTVGQDDHFGNPHHEIDRAVPDGALADRPGGEGWVQKKAGPICDSNTFQVQGDRPVVKERVTDLRQHNEFEKEFEVATKYKGEREGPAAATEHLSRDRIVVGEKDKNACEGHPPAETAAHAHRGTTGQHGTTTGQPGYGTTQQSGYGTGTRNPGL